jgi:hypothetical protein
MKEFFFQYVLIFLATQLNMSRNLAIFFLNLKN